MIRLEYKNLEERATIIAEQESVGNPFFGEENILEGDFLFFGIPEPQPPSETDILAEELVKMKFENMQKDAVISTFGEEITKLKLDLMILKGGA